jgi:hypothetical protein
MQCDGPAWFRLSRSQVKRSCCSCRVTGFGLRRSEIPRLVSDGHGKSRSSNHTATLFFPSKSNRHKMGNRSIMSKSTCGNGRGNGVKAAWVFYLAGFRGFCPSSYLSNRTLAGLGPLAACRYAVFYDYLQAVTTACFALSQLTILTFWSAPHLQHDDNDCGWGSCVEWTLPVGVPSSHIMQV